MKYTREKQSSLIYSIYQWAQPHLQVHPVKHDKKHIQDAPVAKPDKIINNNSLISIYFISDCLFFTNTISQAMTNTTLVRMAVPKLESIPEIPILPKIDVRLANTADKIA